MSKKLNRQETYNYLKESLVGRIKKTTSSDTVQTVDELAVSPIISIYHFVEKFGANHKTNETYDGLVKMIRVSENINRVSPIFEIKNNFVFSNSKYNLPVTVFRKGQFDLPYKGKILLNQIGYVKDFKDNQGHDIPFRVSFNFFYVESESLEKNTPEDLIQIDKSYRLFIDKIEDFEKIPIPLANQIYNYLISNKEEIIQRTFQT